MADGDLTRSRSRSRDREEEEPAWPSPSESEIAELHALYGRVLRGVDTTASPGRQLLNADVILIVWDSLHVHVPSPWGRLTDETLTGSRV